MNSQDDASRASLKLDPEQRQDLQELLEQAPPSLEGWVRQQKMQYLSPAPKKVEQAPEDFAAAELGEDIDKPVLRRKNKPKSATRKVGGVPKVLLSLILVAGIVTGVYWIGHPGSSTQNPHAGMSNVHAQSQGKSEAQKKADLDRVKQLKVGLIDKPNDADALLELGVLQLGLNDPDGAREAWEKVLKIDPNRVEAFYNLGFYYMSQTPPQTSKAEQMWQKVIQKAPDSDMAATIKMHRKNLGQNGSQSMKEN